MEWDAVKVAAGPEEIAVPKPALPQRRPLQQNRLDPEDLLKVAKELVVVNYNTTRNAERSRELPSDGVYVVWFMKTMGNWQAMVASHIVRGLVWQVTFNSHKNEFLLDVYKKVNHVAVRQANTTPEEKP